MLGHLKTEMRNKNTTNLDMMTSLEIVTEMNLEDKKVPEAIAPALPEISKAIDEIAEILKNKGRLIYCGAGTSGRLGVLDAAECMPTFGVPDGVVIGLIAGGEKAMIAAIEGAEDSMSLAKEELEKINYTKNDYLVGIAASGRTPYVIGALEYARAMGGKTCSIACNKGSEISKYSDLAIEVEVGAEILTGSTRLKAGTAQKMILNMLSTGSMIKIGKAYKNLMVDLVATNEKLEERIIRVVSEATDTDIEKAKKTLDEADNNAKVAIVMLLANCSKEEAIDRLEKSEGFVRKAIVVAL